MLTILGPFWLVFRPSCCISFEIAIPKLIFGDFRFGKSPFSTRFAFLISIKRFFFVEGIYMVSRLNIWAFLCHFLNGFSLQLFSHFVGHFCTFFLVEWANFIIHIWSIFSDWGRHWADVQCSFWSIWMGKLSTSFCTIFSPFFTDFKTSLKWNIYWIYGQVFVGLSLDCGQFGVDFWKHFSVDLWSEILVEFDVFFGWDLVNWLIGFFKLFKMIFDRFQPIVCCDF